MDYTKDVLYIFKYVLGSPVNSSILRNGFIFEPHPLPGSVCLHAREVRRRTRVVAEMRTRPLERSHEEGQPRDFWLRVRTAKGPDQLSMLSNMAFVFGIRANELAMRSPPGGQPFTRQHRPWTNHQARSSGQGFDQETQPWFPGPSNPLEVAPNPSRPPNLATNHLWGIPKTALGARGPP